MKNFKKYIGTKGMFFLFAFLVPFLIMLSLFIARGIFPFGQRSFLFSDMYHQYMPFFSEFYDKITAGEGLNYSFQVGIGSNFLALYVYYLASPLHWLAFLFPKEFLIEFLSYLAIIKIGLCGLTAYIYLQKHFNKKGIAPLLFSTFYALSGFMAAYNWNIMWLDCVILLPLIVLGLEMLVKEGKCSLYCISLLVSILTNYYLSIMICIFLLLYFLMLFITEKRSTRTVVHFAVYSLLAGGMAAILLIPEVCAIMQTNFGDVNFPDTIKSYFPMLDVLSRHCLGVATHRGLEHWPNVYCGVAVFCMLPMYALNSEIPIKKRFCMLSLVGIFILSFCTNVLDFVWHGLNYSDSLPARQSFIYIFLVLILCYEAFHYCKQADKQIILKGYLIGVAFLLFCEKFVDSEDFQVGIEVATILFVTAYAVLLYLYHTKEGKRWHIIIASFAVMLVITECSVNTFNTTGGTTSRKEYLSKLEDYEALYQLTTEQEADFYRLEKFTRKTKNDGTLAGYPTASVFSSTLNSQVKDLYKRLGMRHSKVYYGFDGATAFTAALLNVKYMFGESDYFNNDLFANTEKSGDVYLYESQATLPFGYVAPSHFDIPEGFENSPTRLQNAMVEQLGIEGELFRRSTSEKQDEDVVFTACEAGIYYGVLTNSSTKKLAVIGGRLEEQNHKDLKIGGIVYLGYLDQGESITLTNDDPEDTTPNVGADIYLLNEDVLNETLALLSKNHLEEVQYDSTHCSGKLNLTESGRLILSIPYEKGWRVCINGEKVIPALFGDTFMAFDLEAGEYLLEMHYVPEGKVAGIIVSIVCVVIFVFLMIYRKIKHSCR